MYFSPVLPIRARTSALRFVVMLPSTFRRTPRPRLDRRDAVYLPPRDAKSLARPRCARGASSLGDTPEAQRDTSVARAAVRTKGKTTVCEFLCRPSLLGRSERASAATRTGHSRFAADDRRLEPGRRTSHVGPWRANALERDPRAPAGVCGGRDRPDRGAWCPVPPPEREGRSVWTVAGRADGV